MKTLRTGRGRAGRGEQGGPAEDARRTSPCVRRSSRRSRSTGRCGGLAACLLAVAVLGLACTDGPRGPPDAGSPGPGCVAPDGYLAPMAAGQLPAQLVPEPSGLAASRRHPQALYVHGDSGAGPRFFALDERAALLGTFELPGATNVDWEDAAVGPCPAGSCLFLGDMGDNLARRDDLAVYRLPEPELPASPGEVVSLIAERIPFRYPEGPRDAEALMVHPDTGVLYVLTKRADGISDIFRFPLPLAAGTTPVTLEPVGALSISGVTNPQVTSADIHPCGTRFLVRTYSQIFEFRAPSGSPFDTAFSAEPLPVPSPDEFLGEAVAYRHDGDGYFTVPEAGDTLHLVIAR